MCAPVHDDVRTVDEPLARTPTACMNADGTMAI
jgi:hypothetical protein